MIKIVINVEYGGFSLNAPYKSIEGYYFARVFLKNDFGFEVSYTHPMAYNTEKMAIKMVLRMVRDVQKSISSLGSYLLNRDPK